MGHASGKFAIAISDRSGLQFPYTEMVKEWNGAWVHTSEYEPKAPQLMPHEHSPDPQSLKRPRPARGAFPVPNLLPENPLTTTAGSTTVSAKETLHKRSTGDAVRLRDIIGPIGGVSAPVFNLNTTLSIALTDASTSITLNDASAFPSSGYIVINEDKTNSGVPRVVLNETIKYTSKLGNVLGGLTRGSQAPSYGITYGATTARAHDSGSNVYGSYEITVVNTTSPQGDTISNSYTFVLNTAATSTQTAGGFFTSSGPVNSRA
tara:strand:- start:899 stop:1687 length:789 start_codon:yes stop_codon:yes gene_type:complete